MDKNVPQAHELDNFSRIVEPNSKLPIRSSLAERAYDYLFHRIISGRIAHGQSLPSEDDLAALLQVSRPVLREALGRLRKDGLIVTMRGKGSVVCNDPEILRGIVDIDSNIDILLNNMELRIAIEPNAAALAAERRTLNELAEMKDLLDEFADSVIGKKEPGFQLDFKFHLCIARATHNPQFEQVIRSVSHHIEHAVFLARHLASFKHVELGRLVHAEHARVFAAISRQEPTAAREALYEHLERGRKRMLKE